MGRGLSVIGFPGVSSFKDRHGKVRFRFRRKGARTVYLPGLPGSTEFAQAYADAVAGETTKLEIGASRVAPGTLNALIVAYYRSADFKVLNETTQRTYRGIIERLRKDYGHLGIRGMKAQHVRAMLDKRAATPAAANNLLRMVKMLMGFAVERGLRAANPAAAVKPLPIKSDGFHCWTEEEIAAFEARWPLGMRERLAFDLLIYTAQRIGDVRLMGPQHVRGGLLYVRQGKTGAELALPVVPALRASMDAAPSGHLTFLVTQHGQPYSEKGASQWFSAAATAAGLPHCAAHGLRKAAATRIADNGGTDHQIMAVTGHRTLKEVSRYTRTANQKRLAAAGLVGIGGMKAEQPLANPGERLANGARKAKAGKGSS